LDFRLGLRSVDPCEQAFPHLLRVLILDNGLGIRSECQTNLRREEMIPAFDSHQQ